MSPEKRRELVRQIASRGPRLTVNQVVIALRQLGCICSRETARKEMIALGVGVAGTNARKRESEAEAALARELDRQGIGGWTREHAAIPGRRFRFDFAWIEQKVAVEVHGGHWTGGRHVRGAGFESDLEKQRLATRLGWRVVAFTATEVQRKPGEVVAFLSDLLENNPG